MPLIKYYISSGLFLLNVCLFKSFESLISVTAFVNDRIMLTMMKVLLIELHLLPLRLEKVIFLWL